MTRHVGLLPLLIAPIILAASARANTELGVEGERFTVNGTPLFLLGASYYGGAGASDETVRRDLDDLRHDGFNWIRVWATWSAGDRDISAVGADGSPREPWLGRLKKLVEACDEHGMLVDVTLTRQRGGRGPSRLANPDDHRRAVQTLLTALRASRNWYLDLANERNVGDGRFVGYDELKSLRDRAKEVDPARLVTASHSSDDDAFLSALPQYLNTVRVDFVAPHRGRHKGTAAETEAFTRHALGRMRETGRVVPVHFQEPFRRGYADWQPVSDDYVQDLRGAVMGGAAGWCFHNGDDRPSPDHRPRRSFDLGERRLYEQLDDVELDVVGRLKKVADGTSPQARPAK